MIRDKQQIGILVWHWGRRGAGPKISLDFVNALHAHPSFRVHYSVSRDAHIYSEFPAADVPHMDVRTLGSIWRTIWSVAVLPWQALRLVYFIKKHGIAVVLSPMWDVWHIPLAPVVRAVVGLHVLCIHDARPHAGEDHVSPLFRFIWRDARSADLVVCFSRFVRDDVAEELQLDEKRSIAVPLGPSGFGSAIPRPRSAPRTAPRLLCFGRGYRYKGMDLAIEAMSFISESFPTAELVIVGGGEMAKYAGMAQRRPRVTVRAGYLPEEEVAGLFDAADVVLAPYREASQSAIVTTAQTMGVPVVCTPVGGLPEQVMDGETGIVATDVSSQALALATIRLLSDHTLYARCACEGQRSILQERSWERSVEALLEALLPIMPGRPTCG